MAPLAHAKLGPSGSSRWIRCAGSVEASEGYPNTSGLPAAHGTVYHRILEDMVQKNLDPVTLLGSTIEESGFNIPIDDWMVENAYAGYNAASETFGHLPREYKSGRLRVEQRLDLSSFLGPDQFGTSDIVYVKDENLHIWDWKAGRIPVDPEDNSQLAIYAIGAYEGLSQKEKDCIETVHMHIYQPRSDTPHKVWTISIEELLDLRKEYRHAAIATMQESAPRTAGEKQCQWCLARADCFEHAKWLFETNKFETIGESDPERLTTDQIQTIYEKRSAIRNFLTAIEDRFGTLVASGEVEEYYIGDGRPGNRQYVDEKAAREFLEVFLGDEAHTTSLLTPAQADRKLGRGAMNDLTFREAGKKVVLKKKEN